MCTTAIYTKEKGAQTKIYGPLSLALPSERSTRFFGATSSTHWERARRSPFKRSLTLCGDHGNHGGFSDEGTLAVQMVLLSQPHGSFAMRFMRRALASMLGQDVRSWRKRFIKPTGQSLELQWVASSRSRPTIPAQSEVSACEKCRKAEVTQREARQAERGTIGTRSGFTLEFQTISQCTFHDFKLLECTGRKPAIEPGDGTQEDGHPVITRGHRATDRRDHNSCCDLQTQQNPKWTKLAPNSRQLKKPGRSCSINVPPISNTALRDGGV